MAIQIDSKITARALRPKITRLFELSASKIRAIEDSWDPRKGTPVFTIKGKYSSRGWTEWTQGFQFGSALLQFDATEDEEFLELGRRKTVALMAPHVSHIGVHDHGFNNVSTYGNLLRLMREGKIPENEPERNFYEIALKISGAVQAARWTGTADRQGYIYSFNGPHSLFIDTMRSLRSLSVAHSLGHVLMGEHDQKISLLERLIQHATTTAKHAIYYGKGRDLYDVPGRTAHESIFNLNDGQYRCPNSQQGYSPFSTWMRGLAWAILGFAEQLEFMDVVPAEQFPRGASGVTPSNSNRIANKQKRLNQAGAAAATVSKSDVQRMMLKAATATSEFYLENCCTDGVPMWDSGAPELHRLGPYREQAADPFNEWEPVDSSAAVITAQGLIRLGNYLKRIGQKKTGQRYRQAGLTMAETLFSEPYLSIETKHQGLLLHSVYHRPNGWDYMAPGQKVPNGESSMWGDYHALELALTLLRESQEAKYLTFFGGATASA